MKVTGEPAAKQLTLTPSCQATLPQDGFIGSLYQPETNRYPGKAIIAVTGADGSYSLSRLIAEQFARRGLSCLALAYWNQEGLSNVCCHIPLELAERAASWLQQRGCTRVGMWGISLGAVYALLCGIHFPELFSCTVAVSPMNICVQGSQHGKLCKDSAFSFQGVDLPLAQLQVERLRGPLLLLAADQDEVWPARKAAEAILQRLKEHPFSFPVSYYHYADASHYLLPCQINARKIFSIERERPESCENSNRDAFEKTLLFLQTQW